MNAARLTKTTAHWARRRAKSASRVAIRRASTAAVIEGLSEIDEAQREAQQLHQVQAQRDFCREQTKAVRQRIARNLSEAHLHVSDEDLRFLGEAIAAASSEMRQLRELTAWAADLKDVADALSGVCPISHFPASSPFSVPERRDYWWDYD